MKYAEDHSVDISQQVVCSAPYLERGGGTECMWMSISTVKSVRNVLWLREPEDPDTHPCNPSQ